ncbi:MAG: copper chaperone PCu(A)C [Chromatiales bacterium]|nr:copper chaperone PCu(A)C [Gammaproteobacteria bacterium]
MRLNLFDVLAGALLLAVGAQVSAGDVAGMVDVDDPYVRGVPPGQPNTSTYMGLTNRDQQGHALVGAQSPVAKVVELHTHTMEGGMMRMRPVKQVDLPAGQQVKLQPGGLHVMLIGLKQKLKPGESVPLTLLFEDGSTKAMQVPVRKIRMHMKKMSHM